MKKQIRSAYQGALFSGSMIYLVYGFIDLHEGYFNLFTVRTFILSLVLGLAFTLEMIKNVEKSQEDGKDQTR